MIRQARASDEPGIRACAELAYARYVPLMGRRPPPMVADFAAQIAAGKVFIAVDDNDHLLGFIVFYPQDGHILLENVAVLPLLAGRGVGKALIHHCEARARELGFAAVELYTNEKMIANQAIYPHLGYAEIARRSEEGLNRIYYRKTIT